MKNPFRRVASFVLAPLVWLTGSKRAMLDRICTEEELGAIAFARDGYLVEQGWFRARLEKKPVDAQGRPIPWMDYPLVAFLEPRLNAGLKVFEYGAGNSTLWLSSRVKSVTSIENDRGWYDAIRTQLPGNSEIRHVPLEYGGRYCRAILDDGGRYHVVIVDGRDRVACMRNAVDGLEEDGVIILDDAERPQYQEGARALAERGFKRLDFWGVSPGSTLKKCGMLFYRPRNCLGI